MSDVERVNICDEPRIDHDSISDTLTEIVKKIVESYVKTAVDTALEREIDELGKNAEKYLQLSTHSSYSFLEDASFAEMRKNSMSHVFMDNKEYYGETTSQTEGSNKEEEKVNLFIYPFKYLLVYFVNQ